MLLKIFFINPLPTKNQEPQWAECSAPKEGMLQRPIANCLKDKNKKNKTKNLWSVDMWKSPSHPIQKLNNLRTQTK